MHSYSFSIPSKGRLHFIPSTVESGHITEFKPEEHILAQNYPLIFFHVLAGVKRFKPIENVESCNEKILIA